MQTRPNILRCVTPRIATPSRNVQSKPINQFEILRRSDDVIVVSTGNPRREQSRIDWKTHIAKHEYARSIMSWLTSSSRILMLGCGGASIPHEVAHHMTDVDLTVVEICPEALKIGRLLLGHRSALINWVEQDAREYVTKTDIGHFDIIICDVFDTYFNKVPEWTSSDAYLEDVVRLLRPKNGRYIQNTLGDIKVRLGTTVSLARFFDRIWIETIGGSPQEQNHVFVCSPKSKL